MPVDMDFVSQIKLISTYVTVISVHCWKLLFHLRSGAVFLIHYLAVRKVLSLTCAVVGEVEQTISILNFRS